MSVLERIVQRARPPRVTIEPMRVRHIPKALEIERAAYERGWSERIFQDELAEARNGRRVYLIARHGQQLLGYAGLLLTGGAPASEAHVTNVAVAPAARRRGVATRLLVALGRQAIAAGCPAWTLEVRATSAGAQILYRRFGFAPAGVRPGYYERGVDAIVMWCHDIQTAEYSALLDELDPQGGSR